MSLLFTALYAKCPYYVLLMCKVSLLFTALYAKCPYYLVLHMLSILIIQELVTPGGKVQADIYYIMEYCE